MGDLNPECLIDFFRLDRGFGYTMGKIEVAFPVNNSTCWNHSLACGWEGIHTIVESIPSCEK